MLHEQLLLAYVFLMARKNRHQTQSDPTTEDYQRFAEDFTDAVLDPRQPWLIEYIMAFGFPPIPSEEQLSSGALAVKMHVAIEGGFLVDEERYEALMKPDRQKLVDGFRDEAMARKLTLDELSRLLASANFKALKKSLKALGEPFKFRPGPTPPSKRQFDEALRQSEVLQPALLKFLNQQSSGTTHSTREILRFLSKDCPEGCKFLIENISRVEKCLKNPGLAQKAKTRPLARAQVLADAMAGSVCLNRQFTTAVEYIRAERRRRKASL